jgi:hypothetical protein
MRIVWLGLLLAAAALAANVKMYMKDGSYQVVREYSVKDDRVRFYSVERSSWEEVPLSLVDLKRTEAEVSERKATLSEEAKVLSEEDKAERALQDEIMKIPQTPGVYYVQDGKAVVVPQGRSTVHTAKGRAILSAMSPVPLVPGKSTLILLEKHSRNVLHNPQQEFYIQLSEEERFGIVKLDERMSERIVEKITVIPVSKEVVEEPTEVEIFRKQLTPDGLYKIWPMQPLAPGEYAVVQYTAGKLNMQVWDFRCAPEKTADKPGKTADKK